MASFRTKVLFPERAFSLEELYKSSPIPQLVRDEWYREQALGKVGRLVSPIPYLNNLPYVPMMSGTARLVPSMQRPGKNQTSNAYVNQNRKINQDEKQPRTSSPADSIDTSDYSDSESDELSLNDEALTSNQQPGGTRYDSTKEDRPVTPVTNLMHSELPSTPVIRDKIRGIVSSLQSEPDEDTATNPPNTVLDVSPGTEFVEDSSIENTMTSADPPVAAKLLKSSVKPSSRKSEHVLTRWIIKPMPSCKGLCVEGVRSKDPEETFWHSTAIMGRIDNLTVTTATGSVYKLVGKMDVADALEAGFSKVVVKAFLDGFPPNWNTVIEKFYAPKVTKKKKGAAKKNRTFAGAGPKQTPVTTKSRKSEPPGKVNSSICFQTPTLPSIKELPKTRSGRAVKPQLAWWAGQRVRVHNKTGEVEITEVESPDLISAMRTPKLKSRSAKRNQACTGPKVKRTPVVTRTRKSEPPSGVNSSINFQTPILPRMKELPKTRSGRAVKPQLAWWAGQRVRVHNKTGEVEITDVSSPDLDLTFDNISIRQANHTLSLGRSIKGRILKLDDDSKVKTMQKNCSDGDSDVKISKSPVLVLTKVINDSMSSKVKDSPERSADDGKSTGSKGTLEIAKRILPRDSESDSDTDCYNGSDRDSKKRSVPKSTVDNKKAKKPQKTAPDSLRSESEEDDNSVPNKKVSKQPQSKQGEKPTRNKKVSRPRKTQTDSHSQKDDHISDDEKNSEEKQSESGKATRHHGKSSSGGRRLRTPVTSSGPNVAGVSRVTRSATRGSGTNPTKNPRYEEHDTDHDFSSCEARVKKVTRSKTQTRGMCREVTSDGDFSDSPAVEEKVTRKSRQIRGRNQTGKKNVTCEGDLSNSSDVEKVTRNRKQTRGKNKIGKKNVTSEGDMSDSSDEEKMTRNRRQIRGKNQRPRKKVTSEGDMSDSSDEEKMTRNRRQIRGKNQRPRKKVTSEGDMSDSSDEEKMTRNRRQIRGKNQRPRKKVTSEEDMSDSSDEEKMTRNRRQIRGKNQRPRKKVTSEGDMSDSSVVEQKVTRSGLEKSGKGNITRKTVDREIGPGIDLSKAEPEVKQKKTSAKNQKTVNRKGGKRKADQSHPDTSPKPKPWTKKEKDALYNAVKQNSPDDSEFWAFVASAVPSRSLEDCQEFYYREVADNKQPAKRKKKSEQKTAKPVALSGRVGTLKRKRELRDLMDLHQDGYEDDLFDATPMRNKIVKAPVFNDDDDDDIFGDKLPFDTPAVSRTPFIRNLEPVSTRKTPYMGGHTPGIQGPVDRNQIDRYIHRLKKRRKMSPPTKVVKEKVATEVEYQDDLFTVEERPISDSEEEQDNYWSDE